MMDENIAGLVAGAIVLCAVAFVFGAPPVHAGECGKASWYGAAHHGKTMANGRPFDQWAMTAASWNYPLGAKVRVTAAGKSIVVTITDRGPAKRLRRVIDLSEAAFGKLASTRKGIITACVVRL